MTNQPQASIPSPIMNQETKDPVLQTLTKGFQLMMKMGYTPGTGLGRSGEGMKYPIPICDKQNRYGLGYDPKNDSKPTKKPSLTLNGQFILQNDD